MKKTKLIGVLSLAILLAGCGTTNSSENSSNNPQSSDSSVNENSSKESSVSSESSISSESSSSSSSIDDNSISFENALAEIAKLQKEELNNAASVTYKNVDSSTSIVNTTEQVYTNYLDGSSSSKGTYKRLVDGKLETSDTFKTVATKVTDAYEDETDSSKTNEFDMFVKVTDYSNPSKNPQAYQDSASKLFIVDTDAEATAAGLSSSQYILSSDFQANAAANLTGNLYNFVGGNIVENMYVAQTGKKSVTPVTLENGDIYYNIDVTYSYTESGETVTTQLKAEYTMNSTKTRLISYDCLNKVTYSRDGDSTDQAFSSLRESGTITYGTKTDGFGDDVINPNDYFLTSVSSVKLTAKDSYWKVHDVEDLTVSSSYSTIYGYANKYEPANTVYTQLTASSSSNEDVIKVDDQGNFEIVGAGTADLTYEYYAKRETTGAYYLTSITVSGVTVTKAQITSISFSSTSDIGNRSTSLLSGKTYTWRYATEPSSTMNEPITATSSKEDVATVEVSASGELTITTLKQGLVTITLASADDPTVKVEKTFYVINAAMNFTNFLTQHTFKHTSIWGYSVTLKFSADGTCERVQTITDSGKEYTDTFNWELDGNEISFSDFSSSWKNWDEGRISMFLNDGKVGALGLTLECDSDSSTMEFSQVSTAE